MRTFGLTLFALVSLVVHVTAAAFFLSNANEIQEERGAGATALEVGDLFNSSMQEKVEAQDLPEAKTPPKELQTTKVVQAIPVKSFVQEQVQPKRIESPKVLEVPDSLIKELTANKELIKPDLFKPREIKPIEAKPLKPKKKIKQAKLQKPKEVKKVKPPKKVVKSKAKKKVAKKKKAKKKVKKKAKKKAQKASKASKKGGLSANKKGRKSASGGNGGKKQNVNGRALTTSYMAKVRRKIERKKRALGRRNTGTAVVRFTITPAGRLAGVKLARSSGNARIDKAALSMVRRAAPFGTFPAGMSKKNQTRSLPIKFSR
ncbi:MAG: energy transducer TonB [Cohaesibacter sp.]|nr:energy transducer TonB [Cohaesibacter sp.]